MRTFRFYNRSKRALFVDRVAYRIKGNVLEMVARYKAMDKQPPQYIVDNDILDATYDYETQLLVNPEFITPKQFKALKQQVIHQVSTIQKLGA